MKTLILILLSFLLINCSQDKLPLISQPSEQESQLVKQVGDSLAMKLLGSLKTELLKSIEEKGLAGSVSFCNLQAAELTASVSPNIKRISAKVRNPKNKASFSEQKALDFYFSQGDSIVPFFIQKIEQNNIRYFQYYKPLTIQPLCLNCHGSRENIPADVKQKLAELYPNDNAINYKLDELRGLVRVKVQL